MTLLVAAHRALLRSLNTRLWDPPAKENCGSASRRLQWNSSADTSSHPDVFFAQSGGDGWVCGRFRATARRHCTAYPYSLKSQLKWHIFLERLLHAQVEHLTLPCTITVGNSVVFSATFILYQPIRSHRAFWWSKPAYACADLLQCWDKKAHKFIRLQLRRAAAGSRAVVQHCQEAAFWVLWEELVLMSMACLLTAWFNQVQ